MRFDLSVLLPAALVLACAQACGPQNTPAPAARGLVFLGRYESERFDVGAAEIVAHDPGTQRLFVVNGDLGGLDVLDFAQPARPTLFATVDLSDYGRPNSVACHAGRVAVALEAEVATEAGQVALLDTEGKLLALVRVGAMPDMLTFTPDGRRLLVANEGEPNDDYTVDPEGTLSVIELSADGTPPTNADVVTLDFRHFDAAPPPGVRVFGPGARLSQDVEPEYVAVAPDGKRAWVVLQENNALALVDLVHLRIDGLVSLGTKDHSLAGAGLDPSDRDEGVHIQPWPVRGLYQPDSIAAIATSAGLFLVTANEGDTRLYGDFQEQQRVSDADLDPERFPDAKRLQKPKRLGRLFVSTMSGDIDADGDLDELHAFGARSLSVWTTSGELVADTGDELERITAESNPDGFNATNERNDSTDERSPRKGPEPEGLAYGFIDGRPLVFVGLERPSGIAVYDLSDPSAPRLLTYVSTRDFSAEDAEEAGDLGPEGLLFIPAADSPNARPLLVVAYEVSGTTVVYEVRLRE